ncbi:MAG: hypothetical protein Q8O98_02075 [bacterium]|nr:hypothetical protein [bacterium]
MPKNKIIIALGFIIALLPILGFPRAWESFFQIAAGLLIAFMSVLITIDKKISQRVKAQKRAAKRVQAEPVSEETVVPEENPTF